MRHEIHSMKQSVRNKKETKLRKKQRGACKLVTSSINLKVSPPRATLEYVSIFTLQQACPLAMDPKAYLWSKQ